MTTKTIRPIAAAIAASFLAMSVIPIASADTNPFVLTELSAGYELAGADKSRVEGKCGGGNAGSADKSQKAEGKCGGSSAKQEGSKAEGEGKCGGSNAGSTGKSEKAEGKCGEGKCGGAV